MEDVKNNDESPSFPTTKGKTVTSKPLDLAKFLEILMVHKLTAESINSFEEEYNEYLDKNEDEFQGIKSLNFKLDKNFEKPVFLTQIKKYLVLNINNRKLLFRDNENNETEIHISEEILNISEISEDKILIETKDKIYIILLSQQQQIEYSFPNFLPLLEIDINEYIISFDKNIYYFNGRLHELSENTLKEKITNVSSNYYFCKIIDYKNEKILFIINKDENEKGSFISIYKFNRYLKDLKKLTKINKEEYNEDFDFIEEKAISIILNNEKIIILICLPNEQKILNINIEKSENEFQISKDYFELTKKAYSILNIRKKKVYILNPEEEFSSFYMIGFENAIEIYYFQDKYEGKGKRSLLPLKDISIEENGQFVRIIQNQNYYLIGIRSNSNIEYKKYYLEGK